jgi:hypothetical protein
MGPNRRAQDRERAEAERKAVADAQKIVAIWNARQAGGRELWFYPTIGAAIAAGVMKRRAFIAAVGGVAVSRLAAQSRAM